MFRKVRPNDRLAITADDWNACLEAARAHRNNPQHFPPPDLTLENQNYLAVTAKNETGFELPERGIARLTDPLFLPAANQRSFLNRLAFRAEGPQVGEDFAVALRPLATDRPGPFVVGGIVACKIHVLDVSHQYAVPVANEVNHLESAPSGTARIRWIDTPSVGQTKWALIDLGGTNANTPIVAGTVKTTFDPIETDVVLEDLRHVVGHAFTIEVDTELTVYNAQLQAGYAGQTALAIRNETESRWELAYLTPSGLVWFRATLAAELTNVHTTAQLASLDPMGQFLTMPLTVTARNDQKFAGDPGDPVIGLYDPMHPTNAYELWSVPRRLVSVVKSIFIDDTNPAAPQTKAVRQKLMAHTWTAGEETIVVDNMSICQAANP